MAEQTMKLKQELTEKLQSVSDAMQLDQIRVEYLGKNGLITGLLKGMKDLSIEEKKTFGQEVNELKNEAAEMIATKGEELKNAEILKEINSMPEFDVSSPAKLDRGSYHPITLVQRQCEKIFKSMGFTVEDYSEVVSDYECFDSLNIPKHHPARDMQDTYYLDNGQLLKSHTSAAQNAIYKK